MNTEKEEIIELRITFYGPDAAAVKRQLLSTIETVPEFAEAQGVVEGITEGQDLDHVAPESVFSETEDASNISIFFGTTHLAVQMHDRLVRELPADPAAPVQPPSGWKADLRRIRNTTWQEAWGTEFKPFSTALFDVAPFSNDARPHPGPNRHLLLIDPGEAFGTGQHATTLACLLALEKVWGATPSAVPWPWPAFLDVGTGTGILGIAAAKAGAQVVDATEIDPAAVAIARKNASLNGVVMMVTETATVPTEKTYDIVVSNVLTEALVPLIPGLVAATKKGGSLLLAGYIENDAARFADLVATCGGSFIFIVNVRGWVCQVFSRN